MERESRSGSQESDMTTNRKWEMLAAVLILMGGLTREPAPAFLGAGIIIGLEIRNKPSTGAE